MKLPSICEKFKCLCKNFNLFESIPPSTDEHELKSQRISTRLFVLLLICSFFILVFYLFFEQQPIIKHENTPTFEQYTKLYSKYSQTLSCQCKKISNNYNDFLRINYTFHQVCNSVFLTDQWLSYLGSEGNKSYNMYDFRPLGANAFQGIRSFCELVNDKLNQSIKQFYSRQYITGVVTSADVFKSQVNSFVDQFRSATTNSFLQSLLLIRKITDHNALLSAFQTNHAIINSGGPFLNIHSRIYGNCECRYSAMCTSQVAIYDYAPSENVLFRIPGFYEGCYVIEALLQSDLRCFFNQSCINHLERYLLKELAINITALDASLPSEYLPNSTFEQLLDKLMIEQWNVTQMYDQYYNSCQPTECTYSIRTRNDVLYIVTTLFGIIGGLTTVLEFIVPKFVNLIRQKPEEKKSFREHFLLLKQKLKEFIKTFNLFPSVPPTTDQHEHRSQRISTVLFIILLISSFLILLFYLSFDTTTTINRIDTPDIHQYFYLYSKHSQTLWCPCKKISNNYNDFLRIDYTFHQVCNSVFLTDQWFTYLTSNDNQTRYTSDFRALAPDAFRAIRTFCELTNKTIEQSLNQFYSNQYVTGSTVSVDVFESQIRSAIERFRSETITSFLLALQLIRSTTHANPILSAYQSNYILRIEYLGTVNITPADYDNCVCSTSALCSSPISIYNVSGNYAYLMFNVPGFYEGCYVIEALLQSDLRCFFNQSCINHLERYLLKELAINITALDASLPSEYLPNSTFEQLLDKLMIEQWNVTQMYDQYYNSCQPTECTYSIRTRNDVLYIVTTLFGIIGGLTTVLEFIVPKFVNLIRRKSKTKKSFREHFVLLRQQTKNFNLFPSTPPSTDHRKLLSQIISTRIFIILFLCSIIILLCYLSIEIKPKTVRVNTPTLEQYTKLYSQHSSTLTCPCKKLSINYGQFININYTLHQICNSTFMTEEWLIYLGSAEGFEFWANDFRLLGPLLFEGIRTICELIEKTLDHSRKQFYSNQYVTHSALPIDIFNSQMKSFIDNFRSSTTNSFSLSFALIRNTNQANAFLSAQRTNYRMFISIFGNVIDPRKFGDCMCSQSATCTGEMGIYNSSVRSMLFSVPGFRDGCYIIEALLQSDLRCFYNQSCIDHLERYLFKELAINITALDDSLPSEYLPNSTFEELLNNLMIEQWNVTRMYDQYYNSCQPIECFYDIQTRNDALYIVTKLMGIIGGIVTVLPLIVPRVVTFIFYCIHKCKMRNHSQISPN